MISRILILNYEYPPLGGGGANAVFYLLEEFAKLDLAVDLVTSSATGKLELEELSDRVFIHKLPIRKRSLHYWTQKEVIATLIASLRYSSKLSASKEFDLCHAFFTIPGGAIAYRLRGRLPYIVSLRGSDVPGFNLRFSRHYVALQPFIKRIWGAAASVVANSRGLKELALKTKPDQAIGVIENGVDAREFSPNPKKKDTDIFNIICVSRLIERKGIDLLIKALPLVRTEVKKTKLTLVGEGNLEAELKSLARKQSVVDDIDWRGYVAHSQLPNLYRTADLFVLPSKSEGMSNSLLEAMACGLPVIVGDTGGVGELVNGNGVVIKNLTPIDIADEIVSIAKNKQVCRVMGAQSRRVAEAHSWQAVAYAYARCYREIADVDCRV